MENILLELNETFGLNILIERCERNVAGQYDKGVMYINDNLKPFAKGVKAQRPNNYGACLFPNSLSLLSESNLRNVAIAHEFGHAIEDAYRSDKAFRAVREVAERLAPKYLTVYSNRVGCLNTYSEAFAEAFAVYFISPSTLHAMSEELYNAVNDFYVYFIS